MLSRKPPMLVRVALANKMARKQLAPVRRTERNSQMSRFPRRKIDVARQKQIAVTSLADRRPATAIQAFGKAFRERAA
jgi:hypothetical protein